MVKPIPDGYTTLTTTLVFKDARKAIEFYKKAFGATQRYVMPGANGKGVVHAEIQIGNSIIMMSEENAACQSKSVETFGGSPVSFYLYVNDAKAAFKQAVGAGATPIMQVQEMFWGDEMGTVADPFGYCWSFSTHTKDLTPEEIERKGKEFCAQMATNCGDIGKGGL